MREALQEVEVLLVQDTMASASSQNQSVHSHSGVQDGLIDLSLMFAFKLSRPRFAFTTIVAALGRARLDIVTILSSGKLATSGRSRRTPAPLAHVVKCLSGIRGLGEITSGGILRGRHV